MGRFPVKLKFHRRACQIPLIVNHIGGHGVPAKRQVAAVEHMVICHFYFSRQKLLLRAAVEPDGSRKPGFLQEPFQRHCGSGRCGPQQIVAAPVSGASFHNRLLFCRTFLGQSRESVILSQHPDNRTSASVFRVKSVRQFLFIYNNKSFPGEQRPEKIRGLLLLSPCLRIFPYAGANFPAQRFQFFHSGK